MPILPRQGCSTKVEEVQVEEINVTHQVFIVSQCCLSDMGCKETRMDVGFTYNENGRLEIYLSEQGVRLEVQCNKKLRVFLAAFPVTG